jgi:hypothetical protein
MQLGKNHMRFSIKANEKIMFVDHNFFIDNITKNSSNDDNEAKLITLIY